MAQVELIMPKMGESIIEATILRWVKKVGDTIKADETILEIATDKVDSEVPSPCAGVITELFFKENDVVAIGKVIAMISTDRSQPVTHDTDRSPYDNDSSSSVPVATSQPEEKIAITSENGRFYSPLVRNIAKQEKISVNELDGISGSGAQGRVTKSDILSYVSNKSVAPIPAPVVTAPVMAATTNNAVPQAVSNVLGGNVEIIEMDRMRRLIADHMVMSKHTSPHVTSFVEADVTNLVNWRNKAKKEFQQKYNENITFTPIFIEAVTKAIRDFPMINASVNGTQIIVKKDINIGMAAALPSGNLIVPVIRNTDHLNLVGLTKAVNALANRARTNQLKPDEIQGGTFTLTNVGTFGNVMGTPIINQPQVAILATGAIRKKPAVIETEYGDVIAIRQMMFLSLSYDHRVVDGFLGGSFLKRVADYLEGFDVKRSV
ncbi:MAG: hypothetical protein RLZZ292_3269 [Bacteroidota bacterium]|jgi:2-oxoglutarate dehydrogenase E2 component (dihydrolipoamide succinyltransferase)